MLISNVPLIAILDFPIKSDKSSIAILSTSFPKTTPSSHRITSLLNRSSTPVVPNVVHFVWFGDEYKPLEFQHFLSIKSAYKNISPEKIIFHCNNPPIGKWWIKLKKEVKLAIVHRQPPSSIYGHLVKRPEHKSDIARIDILIEQGGIYLDTDVIALKSFDTLRYYDYTMGLEYHGRPGRLNNGVILAKPNATFLHIWRETYWNFSTIEWDYHDTIIPYHLQYIYPEIIHVEYKTLNYPSGPDRHLIYDVIYDWSKNYCIHLWYRLHGIPHTANDIRKLNTTFGQIARFVFYNTTQLLI